MKKYYCERSYKCENIRNFSSPTERYAGRVDLYVLAFVMFLVPVVIILVEAW